MIDRGGYHWCNIWLCIQNVAENGTPLSLAQPKHWASMVGLTNDRMVHWYTMSLSYGNNWPIIKDWYRNDNGQSWFRYELMLVTDVSSWFGCESPVWTSFVWRAVILINWSITMDDCWSIAGFVNPWKQLFKDVLENWKCNDAHTCAHRGLSSCNVGMPSTPLNSHGTWLCLSSWGAVAGGAPAGTPSQSALFADSLA